MGVKRSHIKAAAFTVAFLREACGYETVPYLDGVTSRKLSISGGRSGGGASFGTKEKTKKTASGKRTENEREIKTTREK